MEEEFICDNTLQCMGGEDENACDMEYFTKKIFKPSERFVCKKTFKYLSEPYSNVEETLKVTAASATLTTSSTTAPTTDPTTVCVDDEYDPSCVVDDYDYSYDIFGPTTAPTTVSLDDDYNYSYDDDIFGPTTDPTTDPATVSVDDDYNYSYDDDIFGRKRRRRKRDTLQMMEGNKKRRKFFPYRAVECDGVKQCPNGEDEAACDIDSIAIIFLGILNFLGPVGSTQDFNFRGCIWVPCLCHFCLLLPPCSHLWKGSASNNVSSSGLKENQVGNIPNITNYQAQPFFLKVVHH